jgi:preprotein translocase subunit SecG
MMTPFEKLLKFLLDAVLWLAALFLVIVLIMAVCNDT